MTYGYFEEICRELGTCNCVICVFLFLCITVNAELPFSAFDNTGNGELYVQGPNSLCHDFLIAKAGKEDVPKQ